MQLIQAGSIDRDGILSYSWYWLLQSGIYCGDDLVTRGAAVCAAVNSIDFLLIHSESKLILS